MEPLRNRTSATCRVSRCKRYRNCLTRRQVFVELLHEEERKRVVNRPKSRDHAPRAGQQERARQRGNSFLSLNWAHRRVAGRENDEVGIQPQLNNFRSLEKTVFASGRIAQ